MKMTLDTFHGIIPRYPEHDLPANGALRAHDVKLRNGRIEAWREPCDFADVGKHDVSFHTHGCCVTGWDAVVQAAEVAPDWGRFYISGRNSYLEAVATDCHCTPTYYRLGVPAPTAPLSISTTESCGRDTDARAYVYTYVNQWYEESAPSPVTDTVQVADGTNVLVSGIQLPPDGYGIIGANVYRSVTGFRQVQGKEQNKTTDFLFVKFVKFPSTSFTDNILMLGLGQAIETEKTRMPPDGLSNLISIDQTVQLAATKRNKVYRSERFQLYNWPVKYEITLDSNIIHMGQFGMKLFVTTDTVPYVIDVQDCDATHCTQVVPIETPLPDISCGYQNSALMTQFGLVYSSPLGVVLVDSKAGWKIITSKWFSRDDWAKVAPETARFGMYEGFLFIVTDQVSFLLDINGDPYGDVDGTELVTISDTPVAMEQTSAGALMMLENGKVRQWNGSDEFRRYYWESRELSYNKGSDPLGNTWSPSSLKIRTDGGVDFTLVNSREEDAYERVVVSEHPVRLPRLGRHLWWRVRLEGTNAVDFVDLGTAYFTVNKGA